MSSESLFIQSFCGLIQSIKWQYTGRTMPFKVSDHLDIIFYDNKSPDVMKRFSVTSTKLPGIDSLITPSAQTASLTESNLNCGGSEGPDFKE